MLLRHKNLTIRNATTADAPQLEAWWNDGKVMAHAGLPFGSGERAEEIAARIAKDTDEDRRLILELDGRPIGEMRYWRAAEGTAGLGIKICDFSCQEKGLGRRALSLLIAYLFGELGYGKIVLDTNLNNKRAQHVYETLGFRRLRVHENAWTDQDGLPQSSVDYELRPAEFHSFL